MSKISWCSLLLLSSFFSFVPSQAYAGLIYGTTVFRNLVSFDSASPNTLVSSVAISGLVDPFESIAGIDFRPADGRLYALGNAPGSFYRLYTINPITGAATRVQGNTDINLQGTFWGVDFNPAADRIRVIGDNNTSIRLNPNDGSLAGTDTNINPAGSIVAVAYDRNDTNPNTLTTLFGIDSTSDQLVRIGGIDGTPSPNGGVVTNIGALGINTTGSASFDITDTGIAFASLSLIPGGIPSSLYTINLTTGAATLVGVIGDGSDGITGLSATSFSAVPEPTSVALLIFTGLMVGLRCSRRR